MDDIKLTKLATCAGCGAKVGAGTLARLLHDLPVRGDENLLVGFDKSDDAAVYRISDTLAIAQTVDFFPPICDDPRTFGAIAAANALSDIYAMGGEVKTALNILAVPENMPQDAVREILRGGYEKVYEAGGVIAGGHSILDPEPKYGLCVTGFVHPEKMWKNIGAQPGDVLFFTKKLGTGVLTTAAKADLAEKASLEAAYESMQTLNKYAAEAAKKFTVHACTDVTGFGLLGHLFEMAQGSGVEICVDTSALCFLPQAEELAKDGILPAGMYRNRTFAASAVDAGDTPRYLQDLLYDPQSSGGLLFAVPEGEAEDFQKTLAPAVPCLRKIGRVMEKSGEKYIYLKEGKAK